MRIRFASIIFTIAGFLIISQLSAQQVTFDDLINPENISETKKNSGKKWIKDFIALENADAAKEILKNEFLKLEGSKHWVSLNTENDAANELSYQTSKKMYVTNMIIELKAAGFALTNHKIEKNSRTYVYSKGDLKVEIISLSTETADATEYLVTLL
jgi:hypothetical protein